MAVVSNGFENQTRKIKMGGSKTDFVKFQKKKREKRIQYRKEVPGAIFSKKI